ncbi:glycosyltransferase family 39 protein [Robbsia sp. Bb-Pol-6]|uniref:Glycosyltransferase family 39 protein n=1 Tax=Robbsia betulipollinis TaxID=2981849 RepID=A0ABT3ZIG4_9BURK|nr:glycosyltransferase family 39 protein [Robbsia betulipollinis]MCY0385730.1 glycosyltransferase family 39 protein [Robbsia betulipollinis]
MQAIFSRSRRASAPLPVSLSSRTLFLLILALAVVWFVPLGWRHLVPSDEGRYAEMAREMFVTGDWITPRYNGYKYFEKPPLQTWANALTFACFGIGDWQARLYTALTGFSGVLLAGYTGARVFDRATGIATAVILASSPYWNLLGHFNTLDMGLSFWMEVTMCGLLLGQRPGLRPAAARGWMCVCWGGMALAVLSKGLVGLILPGTALILYTVVMRDWALWRRLHFAAGVPVFLVVAVPWFVLVQERNPDFFHFFFVVQQFQRYLTPDQHRPGPIYYFVPILLIGFLPWLSLVAGTVRGRGVGIADGVARAKGVKGGFAPVALLAVWAIFIFVFFSVSHSKLVSYILPIAPALALLLGRTLATRSPAQWRRMLLAYLVVSVVLGIATGRLAHLGSGNTPNALYRAFQPWAVAAVAVATLSTLLALWLNRRNTPASIVAFGAGWLLLGTIAGTGHEVFGRESSGVLLAPAVDAALARQPADTPFYAVDRLDHTLPFYTRHTTIMVHGADELAFGVHAEPARWIPAIDGWIAQWQSRRHALALMSPGTYDVMRARGVPMRVVARDARRVVVEKPADGGD